MQATRNIDEIFYAPLVNMGLIQLRQAIPMQGLEQLSPFILLHHFDIQFEAGHHAFSVPPHPHRGFCPITFMFEGSIEHKDSLGNQEVIHSNEVQWINAARGLIHSETAQQEFIDKGGRFHGIQLWINLKQEDKMKTPSYQAITQHEIVLIESEGVEVRLVSGNYLNKKGPAHSDVITAMMRMKANCEYTLELPSANNTAIYILEGNIIVNEETICERHAFVCFTHEEGFIHLKATENASLLILSGQEIDEPLVTHGPFVMNTQTELLEAMRDYQNGKMGFLY